VARVGQERQGSAEEAEDRFACNEAQVERDANGEGAPKIRRRVNVPVPVPVTMTMTMTMAMAMMTAMDVIMGGVRVVMVMAVVMLMIVVILVIMIVSRVMRRGRHRERSFPAGPLTVHIMSRTR